MARSKHGRSPSLKDSGYEVREWTWGCHNTIIVSIKKDVSSKFQHPLKSAMTTRANTCRRPSSQSSTKNSR